MPIVYAFATSEIFSFFTSSLSTYYLLSLYLYYNFSPKQLFLSMMGKERTIRFDRYIITLREKIRWRYDQLSWVFVPLCYPVEGERVCSKKIKNQKWAQTGSKHSAMGYLL